MNVGVQPQLNIFLQDADIPKVSPGRPGAEHSLAVLAVPCDIRTALPTLLVIRAGIFCFKEVTMIKVQILTTCTYCDGEAYRPVGEA